MKSFTIKNISILDCFHPYVESQLLELWILCSRYQSDVQGNRSYSVSCNLYHWDRIGNLQDPPKECNFLKWKTVFYEAPIGINNHNQATSIEKKLQNFLTMNSFTWATRKTRNFIVNWQIWQIALSINSNYSMAAFR